MSKNITNRQIHLQKVIKDIEFLGLYVNCLINSHFSKTQKKKDNVQGTKTVRGDIGKNKRIICSTSNWQAQKLG